jgi:hypothetical protein
MRDRPDPSMPAASRRASCVSAQRRGRGTHGAGGPGEGSNRAAPARRPSEAIAIATSPPKMRSACVPVTSPCGRAGARRAPPRLELNTKDFRTGMTAPARARVTPRLLWDGGQAVLRQQGKTRGWRLGTPTAETTERATGGVGPQQACVAHAGRGGPARCGAAADNESRGDGRRPRGNARACGPARVDPTDDRRQPPTPWMSRARRAARGAQRLQGLRHAGKACEPDARPRKPAMRSAAAAARDARAAEQTERSARR